MEDLYFMFNLFIYYLSFGSNKILKILSQLSKTQIGWTSLMGPSIKIEKENQRENRTTNGQHK